MEKFRLKGIKGFKDTGDIEIKPITIIIGQNNSGKSSILRFPLVLKQTFLDDSIAPLLFYGKSIDYGNYDDVVFRHNNKESMKFSVSINSKELYNKYFFLDSYDYLKKCKFLDINVSIFMGENKTLEVETVEIIGQPSDYPVFSYKLFEDKKNGEVDFGNNKKFDIIRGELYFDKFFPELRLNKKSKKREKILKLEQELWHFFLSLNSYFNNLSNAISYIGPFRVNPERAYRYKENAVNYVGQDGEFAPVILAQDLKKGGELVKAVSDFLLDTLGVSLSIQNLVGSEGMESTDFFRILIYDHVTQVGNNLIDVGFGLSQLIPVVIQALMDPTSDRRRGHRSNSSSSVHIIEQPELHLHPAAQASLIDLFLKGIQKYKNKRFIIETHSEHMLLRLRRYIIEGKLNSNDVNLYYTYKEVDGEKNVIKKLDIDEFGNISEWPKGFFEEDFDELSKLQEALLRKSDKKSEGKLPWL